MKRCNLLMGWQKLVVVVSLATLGIMLPMATAFCRIIDAFAKPTPMITPSAIRPAAALCAARLRAPSLAAS